MIKFVTFSTESSQSFIRKFEYWSLTLVAYEKKNAQRIEAKFVYNLALTFK